MPNTSSAPTTPSDNKINQSMSESKFISCDYGFSGVYFETGASTTPYIVNGALNAALSILTVLGNALVFSAIRKVTSLHMPSKLGLYSLVLTDLGVGLVSQPLFATYLTAKAKVLSVGVMCTSFGLFHIVASCLTCASLLTVTLLSLDRYIAFHFHLRYHDIVTVKRAITLVVCVWLTAGLASLVAFLWRDKLYFPIAIALLCTCLPVTTFSYLKILWGLRYHTRTSNLIQDQFQAKGQRRAGRTLDVVCYKKSAWSMIWVYYLLLLCYVPSLGVGIAIQVVGFTSTLNCAFEFTITMAFLNSCLNPFVYCWRIPQVRATVLQTVRKTCRH